MAPVSSLTPETAIRGLLWAFPPSRNHAQPRVHPEDEACIQGPEVLEQNPREMEPCGGGSVEVQGLQWRRGWWAAWGESWRSAKHRGSAKHWDAAGSGGTKVCAGREEVGSAGLWDSEPGAREPGSTIEEAWGGQP